MISENIEQFWESLFDVKKQQAAYSLSNGTVLKLPLERNAIEQTKYANWLYGDGLKNTILHIQNLRFSENPKAYFQFDYSTNTFSFEKPEQISTDEFYFFFDYLKEVYRDFDYKVQDAVKEGISHEFQYTELERYVLINSDTHHLVKLEVIHNKNSNPIIVGLGYPVDEEASNTNNPQFFRIIKNLLNEV